MSRYIDAEALINNLKGILEDYADNGLYPTGFGIEDAIDMIEDMPIVDVQEVKHGKWVHLGGDEWCCSECGFVITTEGSWDKPTGKYCEECGAKMDLGRSKG